MNRYKAKIDISKSIDIYFDVPLFTGDSGNSVELSFFMRGEPYPMTGVTVSAKRADGQTVFDMGSISGNTAQYTIANNMHNIPGNLDVQISLTDSAGAFLTSGFLHFSVEKGFSEDSGIEADDRYPIFNTFSEELNKKANLSGGNKFLGKQTIYHTNSDGAVIDIVSESTMPDTVISLSNIDSGQTLKVERNGQIWKGNEKYVTDTELGNKVDMYDADIYGDLYVMQGAVIENVDNNQGHPGLEINHYPTYGNEEPCVRFKSQNVEIANLDHTGQLWKGDKKYVIETELGTKADLAGGNNFSGTQIMNGDADIYGHAKLYNDLYVQNSAEINNEGYPYRPGLVVDNWPEEDMEGNIAPIVRFENKGAETARMDHTGQLWKGNEKYITGTELSQAQAETNETISQTRANALVSDTAESETIIFSDRQPDAHLNTFTIYGVSQQDGTPTPDTPVEVVSAEDFDVVCSGKNLINESNQWYSQHGNVSSTFADGTWTITNAAGASKSAVFEIGSLPAGTYTINQSTAKSLHLQADGKTIWQTASFPKTFTFTAKKENVTITAYPSANTSITISNLQLEFGSAATQYTPYIAPYTAHITGAMRGIPKTGGWAARDYIESDGTSVWKVQNVDETIDECTTESIVNNSAYILASPIRADITGTEAGQAILSAVRAKNIVSVRTEYGDKNPVIPIDTQELSGTNTPVRPLYKVNYNQDINKVINELKQIIVSLGGVIS